MTIKKYQDWERKVEGYLLEQGIIMVSIINRKGAKLVVEATRIIHPPQFNGTVTKPKESES